MLALFQKLHIFLLRWLISESFGFIVRCMIDIPIYFVIKIPYFLPTKAFRNFNGKIWLKKIDRPIRNLIVLEMTTILLFQLFQNVKFVMVLPLIFSSSTSLSYVRLPSEIGKSRYLDWNVTLHFYRLFQVSNLRLYLTLL